MNTLIVKNISPKLSYSDREELLIHFGAINVTNKPNYSFCLFANELQSREAMTRLHQLLVFGQRLRVEFAINQNESHLNLLPTNEPHIREKTNNKSLESFREEKMREFLNQMNYRSVSLGLNYLASPLLKYDYPLATTKIVNNIAHALLSHPRFYTQVLHLMNKMSLPPPFEDQFNTDMIVNFDSHLNNSRINISCSEDSESELESSGNECYSQKLDNNRMKPLKRSLKRLKVGFVGEKAMNAINKRRKIESKINHKSNTTKSETKKVLQKVFQPKSIALKPNIEINIVSDCLKLNQLSNNCDKESAIESSGFGLIEANKQKNSAECEETPICDLTDIISDKELLSNRLPEYEWKKYSVFKEYNHGIPCLRLYVKNIAKHVKYKDLFRIFAKYIDWESETDKNMFDIRLMKSGRMKGQAFITLPNESVAQKALNETNGFLFKDKPIVVVFARSAPNKVLD